MTINLQTLTTKIKDLGDVLAKSNQAIDSDTGMSQTDYEQAVKVVADYNAAVKQKETLMLIQNVSKGDVGGGSEGDKNFMGNLLKDLKGKQKPANPYGKSDIELELEDAVRAMRAGKASGANVAEFSRGLIKDARAMSQQVKTDTAGGSTIQTLVEDTLLYTLGVQSNVDEFVKVDRRKKGNIYTVNNLDVGSTIGRKIVEGAAAAKKTLSNSKTTHSPEIWTADEFRLSYFLQEDTDVAEYIPAIFRNQGRAVMRAIDKSVTQDVGSATETIGLMNSCQGNVELADNVTISYDDLIDLIKAVPAELRNNMEGGMYANHQPFEGKTAFNMHSNTFWDIMKVKDADNFPLYTINVPDEGGRLMPRYMLHGFNILVNDYLDETGVADKTVAIFGNGHYYRKSMFGGLIMRHLNELHALTAEDGVISYMRASGRPHGDVDTDGKTAALATLTTPSA